MSLRFSTSRLAGAALVLGCLGILALTYGVFAQDKKPEPGAPPAVAP